MRRSNAFLEPMRDASCSGPAALPQDRRDLAPAIEAAQADLPADHEAEEQDQRGVLAGQRALGLHAELFVQALNEVGRAQRLPLALREPEEGEQFVAAFLEAADDAYPQTTSRTSEGVISIGEPRIIRGGVRLHF
jgi:hypothetical protein